MIHIQDLIKFQQYGNLINFIDNYIENKIAQENDVEKHEKLVKVYAEGWGDTLTKWSGNIADFLGKARSNINNASDTFWQQYNSHDSQGQLNIALRAKSMLEKAGLLQDKNLKIQLDNAIDMLKNKKKPDNPAAKKQKPESRLGAARKYY